MNIGQAASANLGTLDLNGQNQQIAGLNSTTGTNATASKNTVTSTGAATLTIGGSGNYNYGDGTNTNSGVITGAISLVKQGGGTQTLGDTNTYSGSTTISGGKLVVSGSIGSSAVTVSNSGSVLASGATGTIGNSVTVNSGAILAPGDAGAAGTATVTASTTFNNGSIFSWDISSNGTSYDKLVSAGGLSDGGAAGGSVLRIVAADATFANTFWKTTHSWTDIFTTNGSSAIANWASIFTTVALVNSSFSPINPGAGSFSVSGNTLTWTAVPEPTSALVGVLLGAGLLRRRRK